MFVNGKTTVRTRFAVAPGCLRLSQTRLAVASYLHARRFGGSFLLRVDDAAVKGAEFAAQSIVDGLRWLGLDWDEGPYRQAERLGRYREAADALVRAGHAYPDGDDPVAGVPHRGGNRALSPDMAWALWDDTGWPLRLKVDDGETLVLDDLVRGPVTWTTDALDDPLILNGSGLPTPPFASAVDDADMRVTLVVAADDCLDDVPEQLLAHAAMGTTPPFYAHAAPVAAPFQVSPEDYVKLLDFGFTTAEIAVREELRPESLPYYQCLGYKPEALVDYLSGLGLESPPEAKFDLSGLGVAAEVDPAALLRLSGSHLRGEPVDTVARHCAEVLVQAKYLARPVDDAAMSRVRQVVALCRERIRVYSDILACGFFFYAPPYQMKALRDNIDGRVKEVVAKVIDRLIDLKEWDTTPLSDVVKHVAREHDLRFGEAISALRVALTGSNSWANPFTVMRVIDRDETVARLRSALAAL